MDFDLLKLENDLAKLRKEWVARPDKRSIIELQAKVLLRAKDLHLSKQKDPPASFEEAKRIFS